MARASYTIAPDAMFRDAARIVLLSAFRMMMDNGPGTRAGIEKREPTAEDIEFLHDMRVGSRRLRAALSVYGSIFSKEDFRMLDRAAGDITDALALVRDLDVQIDDLRTTLEKLPENEAYGIERLIARRIKLRDRDRKKLIESLEKFDKSNFERRFTRILDKAAPPREEAREEAFFGEMGESAEEEA